VSAQYYSLRQLAPYQGTVQVVEMPGFRALSTEGRNWRIQMKQTGTRYATHGVWNADNNSANFIETAQTETFIAALRNLPALPFTMKDSLELWLLDSKQRLPLALVSSRLPDSVPPRLDEVNWLAAYPDDFSFVAPSLSSSSAEDASDEPVYAHSEVLHRCVQARAGTLAQAQWFQRDAEAGGTGYRGCRIEAAFEGRHLSQDQFPLLLVAETGWETDREKVLVQDYHAWQAPSLLTQGNISQVTRDQLEREAVKQADKLYALRHVLPERINESMIETAFVQAVISQSSQPGPQGAGSAG